MRQNVIQMWFFEFFLKKVFTNHKKPYIMQMKTKRNNINQENKQHKTTTQQNCPFMDEIGGILL